MPVELDKIRQVLNRPGFEGPQQLKGYIPCNTIGGSANYRGGPNPARYRPMGSSGVTIGTGVDLGQTDAATLRRIGVAEGIVNQLQPYLGKRRMDAVYALYKLPLSVRQDVATALDNAMLGHHLKLISKRYDKEAGTGTFASIPWQAQAVIFSLLYQHGTGGTSKFPLTWAALISQDWSAAAAELCSDNWRYYRNRRHLEGQLLREIAKRE